MLPYRWCPYLDTLPVPLANTSECLLCVWLLLLMLEGRLCWAEIPWCLHDVLRNVGVDVSVTESTSVQHSMSQPHQCKHHDEVKFINMFSAAKDDLDDFRNKIHTNILWKYFVSIVCYVWLMNVYATVLSVFLIPKYMEAQFLLWFTDTQNKPLWVFTNHVMDHNMICEHYWMWTFWKYRDR